MFYGIFGVADHEYDVGFSKFSALGPLGLKFLKKFFKKFQFFQP